MIFTIQNNIIVYANIKNQIRSVVVLRRNITFKKVLASVLCIAVAMCVFSVSSFAAEEPKYDIVFAIDTSTSMNSSDPNRLVPQSIELFTDLIADGKANYGVVAYGVENEVCPMTDSKEVVNDYAEELEYEEKGTDIPEGLAGAESLLEDNGRQQYIVLLTDGKNEYHKRTEVELAADLETVKNSPCKVYTIGLNCDKSEDYKISEPYLMGIAADNNGKNYTVTNRSEILAAYLEISSEIIGVEVDPIDSDTFDIKEDTVVEAVIDIYFDQQITDWRLEGPEGEVYTPASTDIGIKNLDNFIEISLFNPSVGTWRLTHTPDVGDVEIKKYLILNYDVNATVSVSPEEVESSEEVAISVSMSHSGETIKDRLSFFERFECTANIISPDGSVNTVNLTPVTDGYAGTYKADNDTVGEYSVEARIHGGRLDTTTAAKAAFNVVEPEGFPWIILVIVAVLLLAAVAVLFLMIKQRRLRGWFDEFSVSVNGYSATVNGVTAPRKQTFTLYDLLYKYISQTAANNISDVEDFLRSEEGKAAVKELKKMKISVKNGNKTFSFNGSVRGNGSSISWQSSDGCLSIDAIYNDGTDI